MVLASAPLPVPGQHAPMAAIRPAFGPVYQVLLDERRHRLHILDDQFAESPDSTWALLTYDEISGRRLRAAPWHTVISWASVDPSSGLLYLSDTTNNAILVYDADRSAIVRTIKTPDCPGAVSFGALNAYVPITDCVGVIDRQTGSMTLIRTGVAVGTMPVVADESHGTAYAIGGPNRLLVLDLTTNTVRTTLDLTSSRFGDVARGPCGMELDSRRSTLYLLFPWPRHEVWVLDTHHLQGPHRSFSVHKQAYALALDAASKRLFTANHVELKADNDVATDSVSVLSAVSGEIVSNILTPPMPGAGGPGCPVIRVSSSDRRLYVGLQTGGVAIYSLDDASRKPER